MGAVRDLMSWVCPQLFGRRPDGRPYRAVEHVVDPEVRPNWGCLRDRGYCSACPGDEAETRKKREPVVIPRNAARTTVAGVANGSNGSTARRFEAPPSTHRACDRRPPNSTPRPSRNPRPSTPRADPLRSERSQGGTRSTELSVLGW